LARTGFPPGVGSRGRRGLRIPGPGSPAAVWQQVATTSSVRRRPAPGVTRSSTDPLDDLRVRRRRVLICPVPGHVCSLRLGTPRSKPGQDGWSKGTRCRLQRRSSCCRKAGEEASTVPFSNSRYVLSCPSQAHVIEPLRVQPSAASAGSRSPAWDRWPPWIAHSHTRAAGVSPVLRSGKVSRPDLHQRLLRSERAEAYGGAAVTWAARTSAGSTIGTQLSSRSRSFRSGIGARRPGASASRRRERSFQS